MTEIALISSSSPTLSATSPRPPLPSCQAGRYSKVSLLRSRSGGIGGEAVRGLSSSSSTSAPLPIVKGGACEASAGVDLLPSICPDVVVREARPEDAWEVADTHCSSFFPNYRFPIDLMLRVNRFVGLLSGFSVPPGCMRSCLVAVTGCCGLDDDNFNFGSLQGKFGLNRGIVAGILTVDTLADFLPRRGPFRLRRTGIAYISNVAVRESERRKGIAKQLIAKAEACARSWGCQSIALHCDVSNLAATRLYKNLGYKCITIPEHADWPQPKTRPDMQFYFMIKLLAIQPP